MADNGTSFEIDIATRGAESAAEAAVAVARLGQQMQAAQAAVDSAKAAVAAASGPFKAVEQAANSAAVAFEKASAKVSEQRAEFARLQNAGDFSAAERAAAKLDKLVAAQAKAGQAAAEAKAKLDQEAAALDALNAKATGAEKAQQRLASQQAAAKGKLEALSKAASAGQGTGKVNEIAEGLGKLGGPLGQVGQKVFGAAEGFKKLGASLGSAGPYVAIAVAIAAIATAAATLTIAAAVGVGTIAAWAVGLADAARTQRLLAAGIAQSVSGGEQLEATIKKLQTRVPATQDELLGLAKPLADAGLRGAELDAALEKAAIDAAKLKFGPEFQKQMLSLPFQTQRLKSLFSTLFSGLKIEVLLARFEKFVDLFDTTQSTGRAIKVVFESLFQPLIDGVSSWIPKMVSAFIQFEILVLKALIAIKPFGGYIKEVGIAFLILGGIVAAMTAGFVVAVIAPFAVIAGLAVALIIAIRQVASTFVDLYTQLSGMSLGEIGTALIDGLINGIKGGATAVIDALTGVVQGGINAAKAALGIASPSKVFAEIGGYTAEGMAGGVDEGAKDVQSSMESMVAPPAAAGASSGGAAPSGVGLSGVTIIVQAKSDDPQSLAAAFWEAVEALQAQGGRAVPT